MAQIPTARGVSVDSDELGFTLITEEIFLVTTEIQMNWPDLSIGTGELEERRIALAIERMKVAKEHGVDTIVDRAIPGIGRFVPRVKRVAEASPVNIIVCTGWYTWNDLPFFFDFREQFAELIDEPQPSLEDLLVRDIEEGIMDTGVRAGLIKCATDHYGMTDGVRKSIRAATGAHRRTGVPITTHTGVGIGVPSGKLQLKAFEEDGVDLRRVNIGHVDFTPPEVPLSEFEELLAGGSFVSFDTLALTPLLTPGTREARVERITELCKRGYSGQIMLSNGISSFDDLVPEPTTEKFQRFPFYTELVQDLIPVLSDNGVSDEAIEQMTVGNARRFFATGDLGPY